MLQKLACELIRPWQQYLSNDINKFRQKWLVKKSKFVWRKKNPHRAQIFRYFRIKSLNNKKNILADFCANSIDEKKFTKNEYK